MNPLKSPEELAVMREGGQKLGGILEQLLALTVAGENLLHIEEQAQRFIKEAEGTPSFQTVAGYKWATCLCVNEEVVHAIPKDYLLRDGDILTIDTGMLYKGFHTDTAWTKIVQSANPPAGRAGRKVQSAKQNFLKTGEDALWKAIDQARVGNRVGQISQMIQQTIEAAGYGIVKTLVGHGVGRQLHEPPQIPGYLKVRIEETQELVEGMTLAIEVIYAMGNGAVAYLNHDGWTIATKDRSLAAVFEHTVVVTVSGSEVLTLSRSKGCYPEPVEGLTRVGS